MIWRHVANGYGSRRIGRRPTTASPTRSDISRVRPRLSIVADHVLPRAMSSDRPMWSMISGSCGVAFGDRAEQRKLAGRQEHDRQAGLLGRRPEPVRGAVGEPILRAAPRKVSRTPSTRAAPSISEAARRIRLLESDAAHDGEAARIPSDRFQRIIVAVARRGGRHDHNAIDARLVHHRHHLLDGERLGHLRRAASDPRPVRRLGLPQMDLGVDDALTLLALSGDVSVGMEFVPSSGVVSAANRSINSTSICSRPRPRSSSWANVKPSAG